MNSVLTVPNLSQTLLEDLARVGPKYDRWTPQAYFELDGNYLVEYSRGRLEILPMPTLTHQRIAKRLFNAIQEFVTSKKLGGEVLFAGTRVSVGDDTFREPDVLYVPAQWLHLMHEEFVERVGIAVEVVSESNRDHDLQTKRQEYARAGIPEYWIVDPQAQTITVLHLNGDVYTQSTATRSGDRASSTVLQGFDLEVADIFSPH